MKRLIEITIVSLILLGLSFCFGCKEKAGAAETWSKMNFVCSGYDNSGCRCEFVSPPNIKDDSGRFYFYCQEHYNQFPSDWIENERDVFLKIEEPNEPELTFGEAYWSEYEPNEPEEKILICPNHYKRYCKICESVIYKMGWLAPFKGSYLYNQALKEKPEPNEIEITDDQQKIKEWQESFEICKHENRITCSVYGCGCWSCMDCETYSPRNEPNDFKLNYDAITGPLGVISLDFIPTWPQYIELEKDLVIEEPADICEIAGREHDFSVRIELAKGTKIYFKD